MDIDSFLEKEDKGKPKPDGEPEADISQIAEEPKSESLDFQINETKKLMTEKKFEQAERKYIAIKEFFARIVSKQTAEQNRIYVELENINKQMVDGLNSLKTDSEKKVQIITGLLSKARERMEKNELSISNQLYQEINTLFKNLPDIVQEAKLRLEQEITQLHVELSSKTSTANSTEFRTKFSHLRNLLSFAFENLNRGNMQEAVQLYTQINTSYEELPKGFLYEKAMLYKQILKLFKAIHNKHAPPVKPEQIVEDEKQ